VAVASWLQRGDGDGFCVATFDEGRLLRRSGIERPILILYPIPPDLAPDAANLRLAVTVADERLFERTCAAIESTRTALPPDPPLELHLEVETGLGRGGIAVAEVARVVDRIRSLPGVVLGGVWSHLAAPSDRPLSVAASARFDAATAQIAALGGVMPARHLAATGAVLGGTVPLHDRVRLGLGLYGLIPDRLELAGAWRAVGEALAPVMSIHARPVRVLELPAGHGVSYGPSFVTERPSRIATLPLGYGDGWPRILSGRSWALVRGRRVPLVGTVAMDALMADVTDMPGPPVTVDDEFVLLGRQAGPDAGSAVAEIAVADLALARTTISWEVVAQMAQRMTRVYHAAAVPVGVRTLTEEIYLWSPASSSGTGISATWRSTRS